MLVAVLAYGAGVALLALAEYVWLPARNGERTSDWVLQHVGLPGARVACVMLFVALAWPGLYGLPDSESFGELMRTDARLRDWFNLLFLAGLLLPLLPLSDRVSEFVLPLQGALAVALVFRWACIDQLGHALPAFPNAKTIAFVAIWALINRGLAGALRRGRLTGRGEWITESLLLWMQLPVLLVYGRQLGAALA